jgi:cell filamentation protein
MDRQYQYDYEWDSSYCYPHSFILKNKLDIRDGMLLSEAERKLTALRIFTLQSKLVKGNFDLKHLQAIHRFIFQDVYLWAGNLRTVNIAKGNQFCNCRYIGSGSKPIFDKLRTEDHFLIGAEPEQIPEKLAYYLSEINVIHPFREGNGRAQRVFIQYLAQVAGYHVDFTEVSATEMIEASVQAFNCDYRKMTAMFHRITTPVSPREQAQFIRSLSVRSSPVQEAFEDLKDTSDEMHEDEGPHLTLE